MLHTLLWNGHKKARHMNWVQKLVFLIFYILHVTCVTILKVWYVKTSITVLFSIFQSSFIHEYLYNSENFNWGNTPYVLKTCKMRIQNNNNMKTKFHVQQCLACFFFLNRTYTFVFLWRLDYHSINKRRKILRIWIKSIFTYWKSILTIRV